MSKKNNKVRLKIVHVILSRGFAGTERSTAESCNSQSKHHDVVLVCSTKNMRSSSGATILNHIDSHVKVVQVSPGLFLKSRLQKILDEESPDVVHAHLRKPTRLLAGCVTNAVKISTLHIGVNGPEFLQMDALIAISPWQIKNVPKEFKGKLKWIRNSLTPHPHPSAERIKELKSSLLIGPDQFVVGGIGRLSISKGWDTLIEAFDQAAVPDSVLVIIGEGRDKNRLLKQAAKSKSDIRFEAYKHQVKDYYSIFDIFVCPSREEPMGRVILEALDAGTPVIASDIEGPRDMLKEYPGTLVPVDDVSALKKALLRAAQNHQDNTEFDAPDLSTHYVENICSEMLALYHEAINHKYA